MSLYTLYFKNIKSTHSKIIIYLFNKIYFYLYYLTMLYLKIIIIKINAKYIFYLRNHCKSCAR